MLSDTYKSDRYRNLFVVIALALLIIVGIVLSKILTPTSTAQALQNSLWQSYKQQAWDSNTGQTINRQAGQTTSEGQSYTLLRSVWQGDRAVFDKTWQWTRQNLQRPDKLFSWLWLPRSNSSSAGPNSQGSSNTASDADSDIALALLMAGQRWHDSVYTDQAAQIIHSIWQNEVVIINNQPYLAADNIEKTSQTSDIVVNPSYYSPAAYRLFARVDARNGWNALVGSSYRFINQVSQAPLDAGRSSGLPPDWVLVNRQTGALSAPKDAGQTTDFSYNAFRVAWRLGLDWSWFNDPQTKQTLSQFGYLSRQWAQNHKILASYSHAGQPQVDYDSLAIYGGSLGYFDSQQPDQAKAIVGQLLGLYNAQTKQLNQNLDYYDNNWLWFGLALYNKQLPNLAQGVRI